MVPEQPRPELLKRANWDSSRYAHTTVTALLPVCSAKLSTVGPG